MRSTTVCRCAFRSTEAATKRQQPPARDTATDSWAKYTDGDVLWSRQMASNADAVATATIPTMYKKAATNCHHCNQSVKVKASNNLADCNTDLELVAAEAVVQEDVQQHHDPCGAQEVERRKGD